MTTKQNIKSDREALKKIATDDPTLKWKYLSKEKGNEICALLLGFQDAGKSKFVDSALTALAGSYVHVAHSAPSAGDDGHVTQDYLFHQWNEIKARMGDIMGVDESNYPEGVTIPMLLQGRHPFGTNEKFHDSKYLNSPSNPKAVINVVLAVISSDVKDNTVVLSKMRRLIRECIRQNVEVIVALTKMDEVKDVEKEDVLDKNNPIIQQIIRNLAMRIGVEANLIFPVMSIESDEGVATNPMAVLQTLTILKTLADCANTYFQRRAGEVVSEELASDDSDSEYNDWEQPDF